MCRCRARRSVSLPGAADGGSTIRWAPRSRRPALAGQARRRARGPVGLRLTFALVLTAFASDPAEGYRFDERAWDPELWGPGKTMSVVLLDSPEWELDIMEMKRILQLALDVWANIPTADIRWQIDRIVTAEEFEALKHRYGEMTVEPSRGQDHATMIFTDDHLVDCTVRPMPYPQSWNIFISAVHELGHCLGLMHPDPFVFRPYYLRDESLPSYWRHDPIMAHGVVPWGEDVLTVDDAIGHRSFGLARDGSRPRGASSGG